MRLLQEGSAPYEGLALEGRVVLLEELGAESFVHLDLADSTRIIVRAARNPAQNGQTVRVAVDLERALLFDADGKRIRSAAAP